MTGRSKLPAKFMAGRGRALQEMSKMPLEAQEFGRRKRMQEMVFRGEITLEEGRVPESLLRLQTSYSMKGNVRKKQVPPHLVTNGIFSDSVGVKTNSYYSTRLPPAPQQAFKDRTISMKPNAEETLIERDEKITRENKVEKFQGVGHQEARSATKDNPDVFISRSRGTQPLRRPEKPNNRLLNFQKNKDQTTNSVQNMDIVRSKPQENSKKFKENVNAWMDWENNVVVQGSLADDDLDELAVVEDNDDMNDVIVNQYIEALHKEQKKEASKQNSLKITPTRVQQLNKLKSTSNADCARVAPGTLPNPPKGDDRWGGSELKTVESHLGWGALEGSEGNWYNDGSSFWGSGKNPFGGTNWSNCS